jgi:hypothetical protein
MDCATCSANGKRNVSPRLLIRLEKREIAFPDLDEYSFRHNRRDQGNLLFKSILGEVSRRAE